MRIGVEPVVGRLFPPLAVVIQLQIGCRTTSVTTRPPQQLLAAYAEAHSQLDRAVSFRLPNRIEAHDLDELYEAALRLRLIAEEEINRINAEKEATESRLSELEDQIAANSTRRIELSELILGLAREISSLEQQLRNLDNKLRQRQDLLEERDHAVVEIETN